MAVSVEAAFILLDKASGPLKEIRRQALLTDKALRGMGGGGGIGTSGSTRQFTTYGKAIGEVSKTTKTLGQETEKAAKKVDQAGGIFKRTFTHINNWRKALNDTHPVLAKTAAGIGGVLGGLKGLATAFPPMISLAIIAAPAIVALAGSIGALVSSLGAAVGGGVLLGGGLLGSFAVGIGSIVAIAKPAIDATKKYETAVKNLNTALASGSPTAIKARQQQLDAIAKANPGVAKLAQNLKSFSSEWKKATAPGRESFFKLAADGMEVVRKLLPTLAGEANKNTAALQGSFQKILAPFLQSSQFKGLITGLGGIFRANLPGFMSGVVNVIKGLSNILKILTPDLDKAGGAFEGFTNKFRRWTASTKGQGQIREMTQAFHAWWDLLKNIARIMGTIAGVGMGRGTGVVVDWARKVGELADKLQTPAGHRGIDNFFKRSLDQAGQLAGLLKPLAEDLKGIYDILKPLGAATTFIIKNLPTGAVQALTVAYLGLKGASGASKAFSGVMDFLGKSRGSPTNPMYVIDLSGGGGGPGVGGKKGLFSKVKDFFKKGAPAAAGAEGAAEAASGGLAATAGAIALPVAIGVAAAYLSNKYGTDPVKNAINAPRNEVTGNPTVRQSTGSWVGPQGRAKIVAATTLPPATPAVAGMPPILGAKSLTELYAKARKSTHDTITDINNQWLLGSIGVTGKYKDMASDVLKESDYLHRQMHSKNKDAREAATKDWQILKQNVVEQAQAMTSAVVASMGTMHDKIVSGSADAATQATANFNTYATNIQAALKSGAMNAGEASRLLGQGLNAMLKAFGQATIPTAGESVKELMSWQNWWQKGGTGATSNIGSGHGAQATGGRLPGKPQGDHIPLRSRGGNLLGIADGGELVVNRHTEAKANRLLASHGVRLGDLVEGETRPHYAKGGRIGDDGVPHFDTGGIVRQIGSILMHNGFNRIGASGVLGNAYGESNWNPGSVGSGGGGLWGFTASPVSLADLQAYANSQKRSWTDATLQTQFLLQHLTGSEVSGANAAGNPAAAADAFMNSFERPGIPRSSVREAGAVEAFRILSGLKPSGAFGGGGGAAVPQMPHMPHINYPGKKTTMHNIVQGMLNKGVGAANRYIDKHQPVDTSGGIGGGGGGLAGAQGKGGLGTFDGLRVANWIIPILNWARSHGWGGSVTSGYRPGAITNIGNVSNHALTNYPGGAIDVGDQHAIAQGQALWNVVQNYPGTPKLWSAGFGPKAWGPYKDSPHDYGHFSATGHALGGRVPWYAQGADFVANRPQVIGVGDAPGGERVTVTPKGQGKIGNQSLHVEIHKIEVHRKGDIQKIVDEELALLAASIERHL